MTNQAPAITSDIRGPKQIAIGREATYRVRLQNQGGSGADAVVATVRIPSWAEVVNTTATNGVVRQIGGRRFRDHAAMADSAARRPVGRDAERRPDSAGQPAAGARRHLDARSRATRGRSSKCRSRSSSSKSPVRTKCCSASRTSIV